MKFLIKVIVIIVLLFVGAYFVFKSLTINNLDKKLEVLNSDWVTLLKLQDVKNNYLTELIKDNHKNLEYIDSLKMSLADYFRERKNITECNEDFVHKQYLSNKYMLPLIQSDSNNSELTYLGKDKILKDIQNNIEDINVAIAKYNSSAKDYNFYYSSFPNFIIAKSNGLKRKGYFEIRFAVENKDPEILKMEQKEWQRKIEQEHGLSE